MYALLHNVAYKGVCKLGLSPARPKLAIAPPPAHTRLPKKDCYSYYTCTYNFDMRLRWIPEWWRLLKEWIACRLCLETGSRTLWWWWWTIKFVHSLLTFWHLMDCVIVESGSVFFNPVVFIVWASVWVSWSCQVEVYTQFIGTRPNPRHKCYLTVTI